MPTETVVSTLSKVKQEDGSYVTYLPINTAKEVYIDMSTKETLEDKLTELENAASVKIVRWTAE